MLPHKNRRRCPCEGCLPPTATSSRRLSVFDLVSCEIRTWYDCEVLSPQTYFCITPCRKPSLGASVPHRPGPPLPIDILLRLFPHIRLRRNVIMTTSR